MPIELRLSQGHLSKCCKSLQISVVTFTNNITQETTCHFLNFQYIRHIFCTLSLWTSFYNFCSMMPFQQEHGTISYLKFLLYLGILTISWNSRHCIWMTAHSFLFRGTIFDFMLWVVLLTLVHSEFYCLLPSRNNQSDLAIFKFKFWPIILSFTVTRDFPNTECEFNNL